MTLNLGDQVGYLQSRSGEAIKNVKDFIYLGSWIDETEREIKVRKGKTWAAPHRLKIEEYLEVQTLQEAQESRSDCSLLPASRSYRTAQKPGQWKKVRKKFGWNIH